MSYRKHWSSYRVSPGLSIMVVAGSWPPGKYVGGVNLFFYFCPLKVYEFSARSPVKMVNVNKQNVPVVV